MSIQSKALALGAATLATAACLLAVAPAFAQSSQTVTAPRPGEDLIVRSVSYRDLVLTSASDQLALNRRVGYAVKDVCQMDDHMAQRTMEARTSYFACSDFAWSGARPQIATAIAQARAVAQAGGTTRVASLAISVAAPAGS